MPSDEIIRKLSVGAARLTSRRDFLGRVGRGIIGVGLGAGFLLGADRYAWALNSNCSANRTWNSQGGCDADNACINGDSRGCHGFDPTGDMNKANYCPQTSCDTTNEGCQGDHSIRYGYWTCCCQKNGVKRISKCVDCGPGAGTKPNCVCVFNTGEAC